MSSSLDLKKQDSIDEVITLGSNNPSEEEKIVEEFKESHPANQVSTQNPDGIDWLEKLNYADENEPINITQLRPLYQVRKDTSNKKSVLVSVS